VQNQQVRQIILWGRLFQTTSIIYRTLQAKVLVVMLIIQEHGPLDKKSKPENRDQAWILQRYLVLERSTWSVTGFNDFDSKTFAMQTLLKVPKFLRQ
jgi:hypothetical protein